MKVPPVGSVVPELLDERLRKTVNELPVHSHAKSEVADPRHWNVIARYIDALESVALFKVTQAVSLLVSVSKIGINQIRNMSFGARSYSLGYEGVGGRLISVLDQRNNVHESRLGPGFVDGHLGKSDQNIFKKCSDENAAV